MKSTTSRRSIRMGDQIMRELATMLLEESMDPRLELVSISGVKLNKDLKIAKVFYTLSGDKERVANAQKAFEKATGFLRSGLGKRLKLKFVPELRFIYDEFLEEMVYGQQSETNLPDF
ncbi:30S ribosome-binding factor RbfA [Maridesulfovibrio bastinii]|jgi:ribosome-binding factor A|uniref:30S ribosome-binding factor RbfA n=1 Tax=Maridesulfovibrio bastinii TaxID=47157 RepID=UPI000429E7FD|nr:30S ribosome-binding factor RbfA [Maridesulfovibrio bastinii]